MIVAKDGAVPAFERKTKQRGYIAELTAFYESGKLWGVYALDSTENLNSTYVGLRRAVRASGIKVDVCLRNNEIVIMRKGGES